ncbi:hypothetical protein D3C72_1930530 [compost metagenome]
MFCQPPWLATPKAKLPSLKRTSLGSPNASTSWLKAAPSPPKPLVMVRVFRVRPSKLKMPLRLSSTYQPPLASARMAMRRPQLSGVALPAVAQLRWLTVQVAASLETGVFHSTPPFLLMLNSPER